MIVYRASELGGCTKALVAKRLGYKAMEPPADMLRRYEEGNLHEAAVIDWLHHEGFECLYPQQEVNLEVSSSIIVQGHVDGRVLSADNYNLPAERTERVLEIKTMSKDAFKDFVRTRWETPGLIQKYKWQLSAYMLATGLECMFVAKDRNSGTIRREIVETPFHDAVAVRARILAVEAQVRQGMLDMACDWKQYPCPYYYLHDDETVEVVEDAALDALAATYDEARVAETAAKALTKEVRGRVLAALGDRTKVTTDAGTKVTTYTQRNPISYDVEKMREDGVDVDKYASKPTRSARLRVTLPEEKNNDGNRDAGSDHQGVGSGRPD